MAYLGQLLIAGVSFLIFDLIWLGVVAKEMYEEKLGSLMAEQPNVAWAAAFYVMFLVGLIYFAIAPAIANESLEEAMIKGALFGFFTYATWGFTNAAVLKDWPDNLVLIDLAWGTFLSFAVASTTYAVYSGFTS